MFLNIDKLNVLIGPFKSSYRCPSTSFNITFPFPSRYHIIYVLYTNNVLLLMYSYTEMKNIGK